MIVFSDLHLSEETSETVFNEVFPGLIAAAETFGDRLLVCLGDFWHLRYQVSVRLQNMVLAFFSKLDRLGISIALLPGNHDQIDVRGENALSIFELLFNVTVYSAPQWSAYGLWIPYRKDKEDIKRALALPNTRGAPRVVWMHHGVLGAMMNNTAQDTKGIEPGLFDDWTVFCGHYHKRQKVGNVQYVGTPYQTRADETGPTGYAVVDAETFETRFVNTTWGKRYYNLGLADLNKLNFSEVKPGDEIRAIVPPGVDVKNVVGRLNDRGIRCIATQQVMVQEQRLNVGDGNLYDYILAYVDQFKDQLDKDKLLSTYQEITESVGK